MKALPPEVFTELNALRTILVLALAGGIAGLIGVVGALVAPVMYRMIASQWTVWSAVFALAFIFGTIAFI